MSQLSLLFKPVCSSALALTLLCSLLCPRQSFAEDPISPYAGKPTSIHLVPKCPITKETLVISFLNVDQGEATLLTCPDKKTQLLIDAGASNEQYPGANDLFLRNLGKRLATDKHLEFALLTHPHPDHSYGFLTLLTQVQSGSFSIGRYIDNGSNDPDSKIEETIRELTRQTQTPYTDISKTPLKNVALCNTPLGPLALHLVVPSASLASKLHCPENLNECSIISYLSYAGFRVHFMADATTAWEALAAKHLPSLLPSPTHVLKVAHHGASSCSTDFINTLQPLISIISSGRLNPKARPQRQYPQLSSVMVLAKNARKQLNRRLIPQYELTSCAKSPRTGQCDWTNTVVPTTLLGTAKLGSIDIYLQPGQLCIEAEHLTTGINFVFTDETLANHLE